jgi:hypothetical protein
MQATRAIHVAERSTAYMGLQFDDAAYNRRLSAVVTSQTFLFGMERVKARRGAASLSMSA